MSLRNDFSRSFQLFTRLLSRHHTAVGRYRSGAPHDTKYIATRGQHCSLFLSSCNNKSFSPVQGRHRDSRRLISN